ncbi:hypothetical protein Cfor_03210 [Coptotermes formosanus]|uniref:Uncharacterized protein n=1 Tax=Coptotermes formosanus TaxID=36987 RepID=A0A6L2PKB9_COPFO|nr:hypothetical protein Cfor_03210 [Coptotermes formosanus]
MGDIEENEGAVDESSRLMERESSAGEVCVEMEPKTTAHYTDVSTTNTVSNKDLHNAVLSAYQSGKANGEIYRTELFMSQHLKVNMPNKSGYTALRLKYQLLTNIVLRMAKNQHLRASLRHLVISNFLSLKQQNIRSVFFYDLAFYVTLVPVLTLCILCSEYYNTLNDGGVPSNTIGPSSLKESYIMSGMNDSNSRSQPDSSILHILLCSLTVLLLIQTLRQMFQLIIFGQAYIAPVQTGLGILPIIDTFISY